ncbi:hypothetical protein KCH_33860 [Kitasatospora cheerisanensis KCTC 2395]|uniref:Uncharacterized protein n=1 Tax=Kitasatospora cheerisanensis KCTC 2395 TaxID=1348663 RepID=A0A066YY00_9ACTN|nr:hypothetical protein KCH_33860 [Kitasatospora cheerisanensis KCTC 2395]
MRRQLVHSAATSPSANAPRRWRAPDSPMPAVLEPISPARVTRAGRPARRPRRGCGAPAEPFGADLSSRCGVISARGGNNTR